MRFYKKASQQQEASQVEKTMAARAAICENIVKSGVKVGPAREAPTICEPKNQPQSQGEQE